MTFRLHKEDLCLKDAGASHLLIRNVCRSFGNVSAVSDLTIEIGKGEFFSLLGPSGCGKTTLLRLIAGLERIGSGTIAIGDRIVTGEGEWVPPEKRGVGLVFQDYALFPHMTVFDNVAFGLTGCGRNELREKVLELLDIAGLAGMAQRYPHELSGGQQQRVALARALAPSPHVMLLDEPFSNLDADLRAETRLETRKILKEKGTTTVLVTHDQEEAFSLSDRVGILNRGRLEQVGTPEEIYHMPLTRFTAGFVGRADFVPGRIKGKTVVSDIGVFEFAGGEKEEADVDLMIRPDDVDFDVHPEGDSLLIDAQFLGAEVICRILLADGKAIHSIKPSTNVYAVGSRVKITVDPAHIIVFPKEEKQRTNEGHQKNT
jgi:iron(III) transport system ATP-binding protein